LGKVHQCFPLFYFCNPTLLSKGFKNIFLAVPQPTYNRL